MICIHCQEEIHPLRLKAIPGTKTCVNCSTTGAKRGVIVTLGEKDHTCNEIMFLEDDTQYEKYLETQQSIDFDPTSFNDDNIEKEDA